MNSNLHIASTAQTESGHWRTTVTCAECGELGIYDGFQEARAAAAQHMTANVEVGMPATMRLYTDSVAMVVTRVLKASIECARVETDEANRTIRNPGEPFPCIQTPGMVDQVVGAAERFPYSKKLGRYGKGSIGLTLGVSYSVTDYRY